MLIFLLFALFCSEIEPLAEPLAGPQAVYCLMPSIIPLAGDCSHSDWSWKKTTGMKNKLILIAHFRRD